jgi:hypothetical protein
MKHLLGLDGGVRLRFEEGGAERRHGLVLEVGRDVAARCAQPVAVQLFAGDHFTWHRTGYRRITQKRNGIVAEGEIVAASSRVSIVDRFSRRAEHLRISRTVAVEGDSAGCGFLTALEWDLGAAAADDPWFVPGVWYGRNLDVPPYAIGAPGSRASSKYVVFREDRLPLPFAMHFDEARRIVFSIAHLQSRGETLAADDEDPPLIDGRLGFGSLGMYDNCRVFAFWYPGTEGETSYPPMWTLARGNDQSEAPVNPFARKRATTSARGWSHRYHPLQDGFRQEYLLRLDCRRARRFGPACDDQWRKIFDEYRPTVFRADLDRVERASIELLAGMTRRIGDAVGIPTWVDCFSGRPGRLQNTFGIGFVSRNLEAAFLLLEYGQRESAPALTDLGTGILDFWTSRSGTGLSHTELDPASGEWVDARGEEGEPIVFLRDQSDSRRACLRAWSMERDRGVEHPRWLTWAESLGDWLAAHQNPDGSYYRSYHLDGSPATSACADSAHVVPFLLELDSAVGAKSHVRTAVRTAECLWSEFHRNRIYRGGTLDNPNCTDKEASALAFEAYLALYEATGVPRWLAAAEEAARVCESWIFAWNIPMPADDPLRFFPAGRTTIGFQIITTGFSAFDMYLTRQVGEFARLARYTGDRHYRAIAELLLHNTKCTVQLDGEYGYALAGMQIEHWSMGRGRGYGLNSGWLPWVATSHLVSIDAARRFLK